MPGCSNWISLELRLPGYLDDPRITIIIITSLFAAGMERRGAADLLRNVQLLGRAHRSRKLQPLSPSILRVRFTIRYDKMSSKLESDVCCRLQVAPSGESYGGNCRPGKK